MKTPQIARVHAEPPAGISASIVTIGAFDGVHCGHQTLIGAAVRSAATRGGLPTIAWTFDPPPKAVFRHSPVLMNPVEKVHRIACLGVDHVILSHFNEAFRARSAEAFITDLASLNPVEVWVGDDFRFGAKQAGDIALLRRHFNVQLLDPVTCKEGDRISSSRIRRHLLQGELDICRTLIGWPDYFMHPEYETPF